MSIEFPHYLLNEGSGTDTVLTACSTNTNSTVRKIFISFSLFITSTISTLPFFLCVLMCLMILLTLSLFYFPLLPSPAHQYGGFLVEFLTELGDLPMLTVSGVSHNSTSIVVTEYQKGTNVSISTR